MHTMTTLGIPNFLQVSVPVVNGIPTLTLAAKAVFTSV